MFQDNCHKLIEAVLDFVTGHTLPKTNKPTNMSGYGVFLSISISSLPVVTMATPSPLLLSRTMLVMA